MSSEYHKYVVIAVPGAQEGQGGIIRQMDYLKAAWPQESDWKLHWLPTWSHKGCKFCVFVRAIITLIWLRQSRRADVLHVNMASQGSFYRKYILARIARFMRIPLVVHVHGGGFRQFYDDSPAFVQRRIEWLFYHANHCVVLGKSWQHFLELRFRMPYEKITICPNAVPDVKPATKLHEPPHLLFVGQVVARKGIDDMLKALARLNDVSWRMSIAGVGDIAFYREMVLNLGLQARVRFMGWQEQHGLEALYGDADILLLPSYVENQPLCVIEAMARGVAVIASTAGTLTEMIDHGRTGLLIEAGSLDQIEAAVRALLLDAPARHKIAAAARAEYEQRFTLERAIEQWRGIYQESLSY